MAYAVPARFNEGNNAPTHTQANVYNDDIVAIKDKVGTRKRNYLQPFGESGNQRYTLIHRRRYLLYNGTGTIKDPANIVTVDAGEREISLSDPDSAAEAGYYDIDSTWVEYGMVYEVDGCDWCFESDDPT